MPTVLITRTSSGFAQSTAQYFARWGWSVIGAIRNPEVARELAGREAFSLPGMTWMIRSASTPQKPQG
jgi:NADP-dependent 3-hydroxy acid dehydrogenase YdfG